MKNIGLKITLWCVGALILSVMATGMAQADNKNSTLCGTISTNMTLVANQTYDVTCTVTVAENATLTVQRGVELRYTGSDSGYYIINGTLDVNGKSQNPVTFTSQTATPGAWGAITATDTGKLLIDNAIIQYGGAPDNAQVQVLGGEMEFNNVTIEMGLKAGIFAADSSIELYDSTISDHPDYGLRVLGNAGTFIEPIVEDNHFEDNGTYAAHFIFNGGGWGNGRIAGNTGDNNEVVNGIFLEGSVTDSISRLSPNPDFAYLVWTITVPANRQLTIEAGTVLKFLEPPDDYGGTAPNPVRGTGLLLVDGTVITEGTGSDPVYMTSFWDDSVGGDTNNDGFAGGSLPGDWRGVTLRQNGQLQLAHTHVLYAGGGGGANIDNGIGQPPDGTSVTMVGGSVRYSANHGISGSGVLNVRNADIIDNRGRGLSTGGTGSMSQVNDSNIFGNRTEGIWHYGTGTLDATYNYWGSGNGPTACGTSGQGDVVCGSVDYTPFYGVPLAITLVSAETNPIHTTTLPLLALVLLTIITLYSRQHDDKFRRRVRIKSADFHKS